MRVKDFFLLTKTYTGDGVLSSFGVTGSDPGIGQSNITFQSALAFHDNSDNDPSGNYNIFVIDRTISNGSAAFQFAKSAVSGSKIGRAHV